MKISFEGEEIYPRESKIPKALMEYINETDMDPLLFNFSKEDPDGLIQRITPYTLRALYDLKLNHKLFDAILDRTGLCGVYDEDLVYRLSLIKSMDLSYTHLDSLAGLELLSGLEVLKLSFNPIENYEQLWWLDNLKRLSILGCKVQNLYHLGCSDSLRCLNLRYSDIESLKGIEELPNLTVLDVRNCDYLDKSTLNNCDTNQTMILS